MTSKAKSNGKDKNEKNHDEIKPKELKKITDGRILAYTDALAARPDMVPIWPDGVNPNTSPPRPQNPANHPFLIDPGVIEKIKKNIPFDLSQNSAANLESALRWFRIDKEGSSKQVAVSNLSSPWLNLMRLRVTKNLFSGLLVFAPRHSVKNSPGQI